MVTLAILVDSGASVKSSSKLTVLKGLSIMTGLFLLCIQSASPLFAEEAQLATAASDPNQIEFEKGLTFLNQGDLVSATNVFSSLYDKTQSPRIKLEWAKALYLSRKYEESEKLFREVLESNPPMMVRERINQYLDEISISKGRIDISFGMIRDTNPSTVTSDRSVNLFGQTFDYDPGVSSKPQFGKTYNVGLTKGFGLNKWIAAINISGIKFNDIIFDKTNIEESVSYQVSQAPKIQAKLAYSQFLYAGRMLYTYPSVSLKHSTSFSNGSYWNNEVKYGKISYDKYDYLNGPTYTISTSYSYPLIENIFVGIDLNYERSRSHDPTYSFETKMSGFNSMFFIPSLFIKGQLKYTYADRNYDQEDALFALTRADYRRGIYISLVKTDWKLLTMEPSIDLSREKNESNININSYQRDAVTIAFRKSF